VGLALHEVGVQYERAEVEHPAALGLLLKRCELAKRRLSTSEEADVVVPPIRGLLDRAVPLVLNEALVEDAWKPLLRRLLGPCRAALRGAGVSPGDLDEVILVGGATRMPAARRFVRELFGCDPAKGVDPDLAVVHGAALQAALCLQDEAVEDIVVTDVLSHSLGVDTTRRIAGRDVDGYFSPIIRSSTATPRSRRRDRRSTPRSNPIRPGCGWACTRANRVASRTTDKSASST